MAWQFNRPETGTGMVQMFRREKSAEAVKTFRLNGLDPTADYEVTDLDCGTPRRISGKDLMNRGLAQEDRQAARRGSGRLPSREVTCTAAELSVSAGEHPLEV